MNPNQVTDDKANELRLIAAEIIAQLHSAGQLDQLRLLEIQTTSALRLAAETTGMTPSF